MITPTDLIGALERNLGIVRDQTRGLTHADSLLQLPFRGNCMNWVLGHISANRNSILQSWRRARPERSPPRALRIWLGTGVRRRGDILTLEQLLAALEGSQKAIAARLQKLNAEELAREVQSFLGTTTLGQLLFFLYWHDSYHTGQTEALRQLAGKDDKVM